MKARPLIIAFAVASLTLSYDWNPAGAQGVNQSYLAEMPAPDRVIREIQGQDPADTSARQMAAFKQLRKIIEDLAWNLDHRYMTRTTPAEKQIINAYEETYARVWHAGPDKSPTNMHGLEIDFRFREELLNKFFSSTFRAMFKKSFADEDDRRKAKAQAEETQMNQLRADASASVRAEHTGTTDPGMLQGRRCLESGRDHARCLAEAVGGEIKTFTDSMFGGETRKAGLQFNGIYTGRGFGLSFTHALGEYSAIVTCADLVPDPHSYAIELKNNQVVVSVGNGNTSFPLVMQPSGSLLGPGSVAINGRVIVGYARQWVEQRRVADNTVVEGSGHYESVPIFKPKTARCMVGSLTPTVDKNAPEADAGIFSALAALTGSSTDTTPGLRLVGIFAGGPGVNLEFHPDSGTVGCREAAVAHKYTIGIKGGELVVNLDEPHGAAFIYLPDGTIRGPGQLTVNGRKGIGSISQSDTNKVNYIPWADTCNFNVLAPMKWGARLDLSPLGLAPTPKQTIGPANAVLSITSGFPENGPEGAGRGRTLMLLTDNFESILWDSGFPASSVKALPAIATWGISCETNQPICLEGAKAGAKRKAASVVLDNSGQGSFVGVPAGTYYVFGQFIFNRRHYVWNYRIDLQPGQNTLKLTDENATLKLGG